jgi:hypothetical protein
MEGTEPATSPVTKSKTGSRDAVDTGGRKLIAAKVSQAETLHMDSRPLNEPTAKPCLEAVCIPAGYLKTRTEHLSTYVGRRIIQVAKGGVEGSPDINVERQSCSMMNVKADLQAQLAAVMEQHAADVRQQAAAAAQLEATTAQLEHLQKQLEAARADLVPAEADRGSAGEQLMPAQMQLVPAEADLGSEEKQLVCAWMQLMPPEADLMPAEADQGSVEVQLLPAETPLMSARARTADTARKRTPSAVTEDPGPVLHSEREAVQLQYVQELRDLWKARRC